METRSRFPRNNTSLSKASTADGPFLASSSVALSWPTFFSPSFNDTNEGFLVLLFSAFCSLLRALRFFFSGLSDKSGHKQLDGCTQQLASTTQTMGSTPTQPQQCRTSSACARSRYP